MPSFDITSEVDHQEIRNAVDQASREVTNRFDFKNTDPSIELDETSITLRCSSEDRLTALRQVVEEKLVKRQVSLKAVSWGKVEEASGGVGPPGRCARRRHLLGQGHASSTSSSRSSGSRGIQSQTQGEQIRVIGKKRDDLQTVIAACKEHDFDIPLQFGNFRD